MKRVDAESIARTLRAALAECLPDSEVADGVSVERILFESPAAKAAKQEIIDVGKKLWLREYVDGNGGNISCRISADHVLCTPTLCSKADLTFEDISLVNLDNERILGARAHTSEILLHLEIYKAVPQARAVIHCHPPHATAYAITGLVPPGDIIPEQEVFIGPVATAPYDTPGTKSFAETVLPFIRSHNTILLENHGIVCWADTVTHAEWCVEIIDTYCRTLILASQLGKPVRQIPPEKIARLLAIKQRLGLPDARLPQVEESTLAPFPFQNRSLSEETSRCANEDRKSEAFEALAAQIIDQVIQFASWRAK